MQPPRASSVAPANATTGFFDIHPKSFISTSSGPDTKRKRIMPRRSTVESHPATSCYRERSWTQLDAVGFNAVDREPDSHLVTVLRPQKVAPRPPDRTRSAGCRTRNELPRCRVLQPRCPLLRVPAS